MFATFAEGTDLGPSPDVFLPFVYEGINFAPAVANGSESPAAAMYTP
jgi:hypothetical protein